MAEKNVNGMMIDATCPTTQCKIECTCYWNCAHFQYRVSGVPKASHLQMSRIMRGLDPDTVHVESTSGPCKYTLLNPLSFSEFATDSQAIATIEDKVPGHGSIVGTVFYAGGDGITLRYKDLLTHVTEPAYITVKCDADKQLQWARLRGRYILDIEPSLQMEGYQTNMGIQFFCHEIGWSERVEAYLHMPVNFGSDREKAGSARLRYMGAVHNAGDQELRFDELFLEARRPALDVASARPYSRVKVVTGAMMESVSEAQAAPSRGSQEDLHTVVPRNELTRHRIGPMRLLPGMTVYRELAAADSELRIRRYVAIDFWSTNEICAVEAELIAPWHLSRGCVISAHELLLESVATAPTVTQPLALHRLPVACSHSAPLVVPLGAADDRVCKMEAIREENNTKEIKLALEYFGDHIGPVVTELRIMNRGMLSRFEVKADEDILKEVDDPAGYSRYDLSFKQRHLSIVMTRNLKF